MFVVNTEIYTVCITCQKDENIEEKVFKVYIVYGKEHKENKLKKKIIKKEGTDKTRRGKDRPAETITKEKETFNFDIFVFLF